MLVLAITGAVIGYLIWAYSHPFSARARCRNRGGRNAGSTSGRRGLCKRCGGSRQVQALFKAGKGG